MLERKQETDRERERKRARDRKRTLFHLLPGEQMKTSRTHEKTMAMNSKLTEKNMAALADAEVDGELGLATPASFHSAARTGLSPDVKAELPSLDALKELFKTVKMP